MKKILPVLLLMTSCCFGQQYQYSFKLDNYVSPENVKSIFDPIRYEFNTMEKPFQNVLNFNFDSQIFTISSEVSLEEHHLENLLQKYQYHLAAFTKIELIEKL